jgi:hypothetical protein
MLSNWRSNDRPNKIALYNAMVDRYSRDLIDLFVEQLTLNATLVLDPTSGTVVSDMDPRDIARWSTGVGPIPLLLSASSTDNVWLNDAPQSGDVDFSANGIGRTFQFRGDAARFPPSYWDTNQKYNLIVHVQLVDGTTTDVTLLKSTASVPLYPFRVVILSESDIGCAKGTQCSEACSALGGYWYDPNTFIRFVSRELFVDLTSMAVVAGRIRSVRCTT